MEREVDGGGEWKAADDSLHNWLSPNGYWLLIYRDICMSNDVLAKVSFEQTAFFWRD